MLWPIGTLKLYRKVAAEQRLSRSPSRLQRDESLPQRRPRSLGAVGGAELAADRRHVEFDSLIADAETMAIALFDSP